MANYRVASRYAKALLDLGIEQNNIDVLYKDMQSVQAAMASRDLKLMVKSPIINSDKKNTIFKMLFEGKLDKLTMSFIELITNKSREHLLPEMATSFVDQYKKHNNITAVTLTTATPLNAGVLETIKKALLDSNVTATEVDVESKVDESLIGGFVIEVGDKLYDASVAHKLNKVRKEFTQNKYIKSF